MDLSNDLISKFVKITNDDKNKNSESTVYGTVVEYNGGMYVRIDGSDLLTPVETTADFKPDERVTVMIKNHSATVTGNITSPATNEGDVTKKVTEAVEDVEGKVITEVEILIADRVSTKQLDAEVARIDTLIAGKATIEELEAVDAKIENLEAENLKAINAEIENLKANKAEINDLKATTAEIEILDAKVANIDTLVNGNLTSDNILSFNITSQNTTMENAFIKDAMIDSITANKIMSGVIDTNNVRVQSTDGSLLIQGTLIQMKDEDGKVRIQIGKDTGGNFTFILYDKSGTGVLIDEDGIKSSNAIADGLIVDAKVADNANISGSKLDIASVITEVNNDNSTTIKSNKIYLDEQNQSLEVAFNSLKTQVETIQDVTIDGDLTAVVEQVQSNTTKIEANKEGISTLVAENTIRKEEIQNLDGEIESVNNTLNSKYSSLEQNVSGFKTTVADTYATKQSVTDVSNKLTNNYSTTSQMNSAIDQKANEITSSVSQTYATKQSVTDVNNKFNNYSTTTQMNSAIDQKANQITSSVSQTYATKQSVTDVSNNLTNNYSTTSQMNSIIQQTASDLTLKFSESGGYNLLQNGHADKGTSYWENNGGGINVLGGASGNATGNFFATSLPQGIRYYDWVKLLPNTHYVYQAKVWTDITFNGNAIIPLHFWFSYNASDKTSDGYTILGYQQNVPNTGKWIQCYVHFVTGTASIYFKPFIYNNLASTSKFYVTELMLSQSRVVQPWSPHPSEVYSGITRIDKDGIRVHHSNANAYTHMSPDGFFVTNNGTDVIQATASGLYVQGNITSGSTIQGSTIQGSRIIGSEFIGNGTGNRVCINNGDYEVQTGTTTKGFFGLRTLDDDGREIPRLALGSSGLNKNNHNYFAVTHYPASNNPLNTNQTYADMTYRTHWYTTSDTSGDISNIRMLDDGDIHLAPVRNLLIKSSFSNGSHNSNTDETTLAEFGTFNGDYARYMETACIRRNGTSKGLILANYNDNGYNAMVRICIDSSNYRFFAPLNSAADISLGSPSYLWQRVCAANGTINTSDRNLKDNIEYIQETLNPKARKSESYSIKDMYDFVKDELSMVTYTMKDDEEQKLKYGFIAQDIINTKIGENIVYQVNDEESSFLGYDTMNYTSTLAGALKQTINEIENLKKEIEELKTRLAALEHNKEDM